MIAELIARLEGRSPQWPRVEREFKTTHPRCEACGTGKGLLAVHHVMPFHINPRLELDPANLITLCEAWIGGNKCHLRIGHLGNWKKWNPNVRADAAKNLAGSGMGVE